MFPIHVDREIDLRPLEMSDADALFTLIARNRDHLDQWMRWTARIQTLQDAQHYIQRHADRYAAGSGFHAGLWVHGELVGGVVCHEIDRDSHKTEIGYWLDAGYTGRGLVTRACRAVITALFQRQGLHRIEIMCMTENRPSRAVAERLGFTFEGVLRESVWISTAFRDHALYSLLDHEWRA